MHACPHCGQPGISTWRKINATGVRPVRCAHCGGLSRLSPWLQTTVYVVGMAAGLGAIALAGKLKNLLPLLLALVALIAAGYISQRHARLQPIDAAQVSRQRHYTGVMAFIVVIVVLVAALISGQMR